jgi:hypothetical protein
MSENYSNETIKKYTDALCNTFYNTGYFTEEEAEKYIKEAKTRVKAADESRVLDPMDVALIITNNTGKLQEYSGIVQSILGQAIATTLGIQAEYMERDEKKAVTLYEQFVGKQFDEAFGPEGYRKIFTGNYEGFMKDFKNYMVASTEVMDEAKLKAAKLEASTVIVEFETALQESVYDGVYSSRAAKLMDSVCYRAAKGRKIVEASPIKVEEPIVEEPIMSLSDSREELKKHLAAM